jgi:hypothetical protein
MHDTTIVDALPAVKTVHPDDIQHADALAFVPIASVTVIADGSASHSRRPPRPQTAPSQDQLVLLPSSLRAHTISLPSSPYRESSSRPGPNAALRNALQSLTAAEEERSDKGEKAGSC